MNSYTEQIDFKKVYPDKPCVEEGCACWMRFNVDGRKYMRDDRNCIKHNEWLKHRISKEALKLHKEIVVDLPS